MEYIATVVKSMEPKMYVIRLWPFYITFELLLPQYNLNRCS